MDENVGFAGKAQMAWKLMLVLSIAEMLILLASTTVFAPVHKSPQ